MTHTGEHDVLGRLAALEAQLRDLSDHREIQQLISFVSPAADSGHADEFADKWVPEGVYNVGDRTFAGRENVRKVVAEGRHLTYMEEGCAHFQTTPHIRVDGDDAAAVNYTLLAIHNAETGLWDARRVSANRWLLRRDDGRWRIVDRTIDVLDGGARARDLLAAALGPA